MYDSNLIFPKPSLMGFLRWVVSPISNRQIVTQRYERTQLSVKEFEPYTCAEKPVLPNIEDKVQSVISEATLMQVGEYLEGEQKITIRIMELDAIWKNINEMIKATLSHRADDEIRASNQRIMQSVQSKRDERRRKQLQEIEQTQKKA